MSRRGGFTLVEVVVALAVLAVALAAASRAIGAGIDVQGNLRQRVLAGWVAENRLAEHRALRDWLPVGESAGQTQMSGESLAWRETVSATPNSQFRRIDVVVSAPSGRELARLTSFLTGPGS